jgi:hypothetical protein
VVIAVATSSACPAKVIITLAATHLVAAPSFLNLRTAAWAKAYIERTLVYPLSNLVAHRCLTSLTFRVPSFSTLVTNVSLAFGACELRRILVWGSHMEPATRFNAPSDQRIRLQRLLVLKSFIFSEKSRFFTQNTLDSLCLQISLARVIEACDLVNLSIFNKLLQL